MAASDYEVRATGTMCPVGYLASGIGYDDTTISITGFVPVEGEADDLVSGMGLLINGEILRLDSTTLPTLTVARGCADTVPAAHPANSLVWFFSRDVASDDREYAATETIGVKLLPFTGGGGTVPVAYAPAQTLTFNWRHVRPYPPGDFKCKGSPWHTEIKLLMPSETALPFTWAHRDRLVQADQLVGHTESSVGPEAGTTYVARVYDLADNMLREVTGITGTSWDYTRVMGLEDLSGQEGYITFCSERDTFESWQGYVTRVLVVDDDTRLTEVNKLRETESGLIRTQE